MKNLPKKVVYVMAGENRFISEVYVDALEHRCKDFERRCAGFERALTEIVEAFSNKCGKTDGFCCDSMVAIAKKALEGEK
jgi:hypothetical protein